MNRPHAALQSRKDHGPVGWPQTWLPATLGNRRLRAFSGASGRTILLPAFAKGDVNYGSGTIWIARSSRPHIRRRGEDL